MPRSDSHLDRGKTARPALAAATRPLVRRGAVLAAWASLLAGGGVQAQSCTFFGGTGSIGFAALDPSSGVTVTASTNLSVFCLPLNYSPTFQFSSAHGSPFSMKHATRNDFIPYTVDVRFIGQGLTQTWRLTATVLGQDYVNAWAGTYSDVLTATVLP